MDVFEHWETTSATAPTSGGIYQQGSLLTSGGDGDALHQNSPSRRNVAVRRRERGSENDDDAGSSIVHLNDIFSLRRIDMSAVLAAAGASTNTLIKPSTAANAPASTSSFHSSLTSTTAIGVASRTQQDQVTIEHVAVQNGVVVLCLSNAKFIRWGLTGTFEPQVIPLPSATSTPLHALGNHKRRGGSTSTPSTSGVYKVFLDPTGSHLLVSTRAAEHFYLHARAHSFSRLHKWHGVVVEAVAFDAVYGSESSTRSILLGSNRGEFFEAVLERGLGADKWLGGSSSSASNSGGAGGSGSDPQGPNLKKVHALEDPLPIRSLVVETVEGGGGREGGLAESGVGGGGSTPPEDRQRLVLAATSGPVRLYKFRGGPTFEALFASHREASSLSFQDLGGSASFTSVELRCFRPGETSGGGRRRRTVEALALTTEAGLYHGKVTLRPPPSSLESLITEAALTEYLGPDGKPMGTVHWSQGGRGGGKSSPGRRRRGSGGGGNGGVGQRAGSLPLSLALTEFHFLLLFPGRLQIVSRLSGQQVQHLPIEEASPLPLLHDPVHESFWLPTPHSLFQIVFLPDQEDRDVWRLYLERALLPSPSPASLDPARRFDMAYRYCKDTASRAVVDAAQAAYFFRSKEYELAARCYAKLPPGRGGGKEGGPVGKSFEEIALKFVDVGEEEALKVYLLERLARFQAGEGGGEDGREGGEYKTQRVMLCTWLMEMYLKRLAVLEGTGRGRQGPAEEEEVGRTVEEFQAFLRAHVEDLRIHPAATYQALGSHGRKREMLLFATLIDDVDRVVAFHVGEGEYGPALQLLEEAASERVEGLFHKYAHTLMDAAPLRTLRAWMKTPGLDPVRLLPALAKHIALSSPTTSVPPSPRKQGRGPGEPRTESEAAEVRELGTQFLEHCVASSSQPASSHRQHSSLLPSSSVSAILPNYLLQLYATTDEKEEKLLDFLQTHAPVWTSGMEEDGRGRGGGRGGGRAATPAHSLVTPTLDLQYALLVCSMHRRTRSCVYLYSCMGRFQEAVALALRDGDVALAKEQADKPPRGGGGGGYVASAPCRTHAHGTGVEEGGEALRKRLWQMIARHVIEVGKASPAEAMRLLDESAVLTVEDLIPFFPDFTTIDAFKEKICDSLSQYSSTIQGLKQEMEELAQSTVEMESAVAALRGRHLSIANSQRCGLCRTSAFAHQFYVFPCQHAFHATCLAHHILPYLNTSQRRAVQALQEQLAAEYFGFNEGMGGGVRGSGRKMSQRKAAQVEALQGEIDGYLAAECPFCGDVMIRSIDEPLVGEGKEAKAEAEEWEIM